MPDDKRVDPRQIEERGIAADALVTAVSSGVSSAVGAYVSGKLAGQGGSPPEPPPPQIELPPGVDGD